MKTFQTGSSRGFLLTTSLETFPNFIFEMPFAAAKIILRSKHDLFHLKIFVEMPLER